MKIILFKKTCAVGTDDLDVLERDVNRWLFDEQYEEIFKTHTSLCSTGVSHETIVVTIWYREKEE
jgi:hypothetical protein